MRVGTVVHRSKEQDREVISVDDAMLPAIAGIDACSHWIVIYQTVVREVFERASKEGGREINVGILATRFRDRPSGLGVSIVEYLRKDDELLYVRGLQAQVGDTVLDIQPYVPLTDASPNAVRPRWAVFEKELL